MSATLDLLAFLADPMGTIAEARAAGPVVQSDDGLTLVIDHEQVRRLLSDDRLEVNIVDVLESSGVTGGPFHDWMAISPLNHEGEEHHRWRALMNRTFTPGRVRGVQPFLATEADRLTAELAAAGDIELMADFADVLPALGLCELIGVPAEDRLRFTSLAHTIGWGFRPMDLPFHLAEVDAALTELLAYTADLLDQRRADPRDDLVSHIAVAGPEVGYSAEDCAGFLAGLVFAGNDTTRNQIGWMVGVLVEHPALWDEIGSGAWPVPAAVEELMRYRSAVTGVPRRVAEDVEIDGTVLPAGTSVLLSLWGADSDPAAFRAPAELDPIANTGAPHLGFGHGPHHCLGAALARAELVESLRALTAQLEVPTVRGEITWSLPVGINGPTALPLHVTARPA